MTKIGKSYLIIFLLITISGNLSGQCINVPEPSNTECCMIISGMPFIFAAYRLTANYGLADNDQLGAGNIFGSELTWFPLQSVTEVRSHLVYAFKFAFNNTGTYGPNTPYMSYFIETDYFIRSVKDDIIPVFDPYIGFDFGLTDGFLNNRRSKFAMAPIIGCNFNFSRFFAICFNAKYSFIYENPQSRILQFNLGVQWNLISRML